MTAAGLTRCKSSCRSRSRRPRRRRSAMFGGAVSDAVGRLLDRHGDRAGDVRALRGARRRATYRFNPGERTLEVDRVVALPGCSVHPRPGCPAVHAAVSSRSTCTAGSAARHGVRRGRRHRLRGQARRDRGPAGGRRRGGDRRAGRGGDRTRNRSTQTSARILLGGDKPLYLSAHLTGGHGSDSEISEEPSWSPAAKIAAKYLAPYLESIDGHGAGVGSRRGG